MLYYSGMGTHNQYLLFNKPYGVLCQFTDQRGRSTLKDFIPFKNVYPAGRLDLDSEGLLLLTNDGSLNHRLMSPRFNKTKTYWAQVEGTPTESQINSLRKGVLIQGRKTLPAKVHPMSTEPPLWPRPKPIRFRKSVPTAWVEISIREGKNHQIKKMTAAVGLPCLRLVRVRIGPLELGELQPGQYRMIERPEI